MEAIKNQIFSLSDSIRYVAIYADGKLISGEKPGLENTSSSESDKYEELIVNPTLLKLVTQRGNIDCGGVEYVIIKYGSFFEFVMSIKNGHVSVGIEQDSNLMEIAGKIKNFVVSYC
ncbi:hypothetical protein ACQWU4_14345 [Chryseobacterium sp. MIQD13]|uniref:hypothetical protein n=1 Tax=Chryseobacterium sp. MIQD13 TaxID=3422310 RepID=UPI003D2BDC78